MSSVVNTFVYYVFLNLLPFAVDHANASAATEYQISQQNHFKLYFKLVEDLYINSLAVGRVYLAPPML